MSRAATVALLAELLCLAIVSPQNTSAAWRRAGTYGRLLAVWQAPPVPGGFRRDGEGPFPPPWPLVAFVWKAPCEENHDDATLFFASAPALRKKDSVCRLLANAKLATHCRVSGVGTFVGKWVRFDPQAVPLFVFLELGGGTAGWEVRVFDDWGSYELDGYQNHPFRCVFSGASRLPVYLGDATGDGTPDLILASQKSNISGAAGTPEVWRVMSSTPRGFVKVGHIGKNKLEKLHNLTRLTP